MGTYSIKSPSLFFKMFFYIRFLWTIVSSYYLTIGKNWLPLRGGDDCILTIMDNQLIITTCLYLPNSSLCVSTLKVQEMLVLYVIPLTPIIQMEILKIVLYVPLRILKKICLKVKAVSIRWSFQWFWKPFLMMYWWCINTINDS